MFFEYENPSKDIADIKTLIVVTHFVPNLLVSLWDSKLDIIVETDTTIDIMPISEIETSISWCIMGQADPNNESGSPKLINAK